MLDHLLLGIRVTDDWRLSQSLSTSNLSTSFEETSVKTTRISADVQIHVECTTSILFHKLRCSWTLTLTRAVVAPHTSPKMILKHSIYQAFDHKLACQRQ